MRRIPNIINTITLIIIFIYIIFTHKFYELLINISGNWTSKIYTYSKIPYYLLWISLILSILIKVEALILKKKNNIVVIFPSDVLIVFLLVATFIFTPKFEFLYYKNDMSIYPDSIRYDKLFVCNDFYSNEGDYEGGYGDTKYIYIPVVKKMVYINSKGIQNYNVEYKDNNIVKIGTKEYTIEDSWFSES